MIIQTALLFTAKKENFEAKVEKQLTHLGRVLVQAPIRCGMIRTQCLNQNAKQRSNAVLVIRKVDEALCNFRDIG